MRKILAAVISAVLALALAACGGGGDDENDAAGTPEPVVDDGDIGDLDDVAGFVDEDCRFLLAGAFLNPLAGITPGAGGSPDFEESAQRLEAIADEAPEEIRDAMTVISDRFAQLADVLEGVDLEDPQAFADPEMQAAFAELEDVFDDEFEAAGEAVNAYVEANCSG